MRHLTQPKLLLMRHILFFIIPILLFSCKNSPADEAREKVTAYIKDKVKNPSSYKPISFSSIDTVSDETYKDTALQTLMKDYKPDYKYSVRHDYEIENSDKEKVKMSAYFHFDSTFKIKSTSPSGLNGDYGQLTGNVYWKYNNYVGNKADAGAEITLYSLDIIRENLKFEATADVQGNYKLEKILPGSYLLIVRSKNATDCPNSHLSNLRIYGSTIKQLFGFDIEKYKTQLDEIKVLDSLYYKSIMDFPSNGSFSQMTANSAKTDAISKQRTEKIEKLFEAFPADFKSKIKLYTGYSNAYDFSTIRIEDGKTENIITDFGITCI